MLVYVVQIEQRRVNFWLRFLFGLENSKFRKQIEKNLFLNYFSILMFRRVFEDFGITLLNDQKHRQVFIFNWTIRSVT